MKKFIVHNTISKKQKIPKCLVMGISNKKNITRNKN